MSEIENLIESLSPLERKIMPFLNLSYEEILDKTEIDEISFHRALTFLENKGIIIIKSETKKIIDLGTNGIYYKKNHLPERRLLTLLENSNHLSLEEAKS